MRRDRWLQEKPHNGRLWLTSYNLPFANDAPSVLQLSTNVGYTIRDWEHPLPETGSLAYVLDSGVQAPMLLGQRRQYDIAYTKATQLPFCKAMLQEVSPHRCRLQECTQALARIPHLWYVQ